MPNQVGPMTMCGDERTHGGVGEGACDLVAASGLILAVASALFVNGQTTERTTDAVAQIADTLGVQATLFPGWGELAIQLRNGIRSYHEMIAATPAGVDMHKVAAVMRLVDDLRSDRVKTVDAQSAVDTITRLEPVSCIRYMAMSAAGASALGVIFGAMHLLSIGLIIISAGTGAYLRRQIGNITHNLLVAPFAAALLAGVIGAVTMRLHLTSVSQLVALCPCMILVPGPHILNGLLDVVRGRIPLGAARLLFAGLIVSAISAGLLAGLSLCGSSLPITAASPPVPLTLDVLAAGVAVAAYGTFFSMPWRMLPLPVAIGMLAHAVRWVLIFHAGASVEAGAFLACFVVGTLVTPIAEYLRLPFAAFGFACVVSLIPGIFLFRMASGLGALASPGEASQGLLLGTVSDGATALLIVVAMAVGLIVPKMGIDHFRFGFLTRVRPEQ